MNRVGLTATAGIVSAATWMAFTYDVEASEWGCEVLLCASSSNPSWRGVPACRPPMYRLISAMKGWGFSWPTMAVVRAISACRFAIVVRRALAVATVASKPSRCPAHYGKIHTISTFGTTSAMSRDIGSTLDTSRLGRDYLSFPSSSPQNA